MATNNKRQTLRVQTVRARLNKAAERASARAYRISKALELPIQVIEKGQIVEKTADGAIRTIKKIQRVQSKYKVKKGDVLWLDPKD